jgi:glutamine synthetase
MHDVFAKYSINADFSAKPFPDQPGSGLHIHVHVEDVDGNNLFYREGEDFSAELLCAIGGLLELMNAHMPIFAPTEASYKRFASKSNAPTTVSWGTNNRTVAVRLPQKPMNNKHIEHRVAGSDADVEAVIDAILLAVHYGFQNKCDPGKPVYGDASLEQYALPPLAKSLEEARTYAAESIALRKTATNSIAAATV